VNKSRPVVMASSSGDRLSARMHVISVLVFKLEVAVCVWLRSNIFVACLVIRWPQAFHTLATLSIENHVYGAAYGSTQTIVK
jgi:hypothetical protein